MFMTQGRWKTGKTARSGQAPDASHLAAILDVKNDGDGGSDDPDEDP
jgi:hypothetical protein